MTAVVRPRIALTLSRPGTLQQASHARYRDALERAGADVVAVHPGDALPENVDGVCLSGGGDIAAARYGADDLACDDVDPARDDLELALARRALDLDLPLLGICRGFQLLNVARGGALLQHVEGHRPADREGLVEHRGLTIDARSRLGAAIGPGPLVVNSRHHQAVTDDTLGRGLVATAFVDALVEAFEATDKRWVVGVQWHPERMNEVSEEARRIFEAFVREGARTTTSTA